MVELVPSRGASVVLILNEPPDRTLGVGGFESSERSLRRPAKWYKQVPDDTISLNCTLDLDAIPGFTAKIETRIRWLQQMGLAENWQPEPPTVKLLGDVWDRDKTITWVIQSQGINLGERLWTPEGDLRRQQVTIQLERYSGLDEIDPIRVKSTRTKKGKRRRARTIKTKSGDTLRAVALRELGSATRWKDIVSWNKKRLKHVDPDERLRTGTHLTIR